MIFLDPTTDLAFKKLFGDQEKYEQILIGYEEGFKQGYEEGFKQGLEQGREKSREESKKEKLENARQLLLKLDAQEVAYLMGLSPDEINQLKKQ
jgi:flagellar biosynthesis/type III secretory pathway protein FliH